MENKIEIELWYYYLFFNCPACLIIRFCVICERILVFLQKQMPYWFCFVRILAKALNNYVSTIKYAIRFLCVLENQSTFTGHIYFRTAIRWVSKYNFPNSTAIHVNTIERKYNSFLLSTLKLTFMFVSLSFTSWLLGVALTLETRISIENCDFEG